MKPSPLPTTPKLPSRRASAILAAGMLVAGIALGAAIGPGPAASLASGTRAAAVARVLALMALDGTGAGGQMLLSASAGQPTSTGPAQTHTPQQTTNAATASPVTTPGTHAGAGERGAGSSSSETSAQSNPSANAPSQTGGGHPGSGTTPNGSEGNEKQARLAPIAHVWLIVLPYGQSFASVLGQASAAPYLTGQLVGQGTLLSGYSSLAAGELASAATLLSGAVSAGVSTIAHTCASAPGGTAGETPCPASELAGAQAADAFLQTVVPQIAATAAYREGGLIAITFAAGEGAPSVPASGAATAISYPTGTQTSSLTASGTAGALLLSPFLRRPGARTASAFDALAPRASLEELLSNPSKTVRR
ncbi:MAG TPA: hypothetical protein VGI76_04410 [Solirubrobacteraceae bacterium]